MLAAEQRARSTRCKTFDKNKTTWISFLLPLQVFPQGDWAGSQPH